MTLALFDHSVKGIKRMDIYLKKQKKQKLLFLQKYSLCETEGQKVAALRSDERP